MFAESGVADEILDAMEEPFAAWLRWRLGDGSYIGFVAEDEGAVVGGIGLRLMEWPPGPLHPSQDKRGYILNVFVEPKFRGRGIAGRLIQRAEEEFRRLGITYEVLHATEAGRRVYEKLGWVASPEMGRALG
jgi:GNAT superfamily N-acetyltransferase